MTMRLVFFGTAGSFHYTRIGGTDSFLRRLIDEYATVEDLHVEGIFYGAETREELSPHETTQLRYVETFSEALTLLDDCDPAAVVTTRLEPADRVIFGVYRCRNKEHTYSSIEFFYNDSRLERTIKLSQYTLFPYDGHVVSVSRRIQDAVAVFTDRSDLVLPPVDESYFTPPEPKEEDSPIRLTFVGRVDPRKGIKEVIDLYRRVDQDDDFEFSILGTYIEDDQPAVELHEEIRDDPEIDYTEIDRYSHSPTVDQTVRELLAETDVFVQPYRSLDSTVDTPLLLLESMAGSCATLTRAVGDVERLCGESEFVIDEAEPFGEAALDCLRSLDRETITREKQRVHERALSMGYTTGEVAERFLDVVTRE